MCGETAIATEELELRSPWMGSERASAGFSGVVHAVAASLLGADARSMALAQEGAQPNERGAPAGAPPAPADLSGPQHAQPQAGTCRPRSEGW